MDDFLTHGRLLEGERTISREVLTVLGARGRVRRPPLQMTNQLRIALRQSDKRASPSLRSGRATLITLRP